MKGPSASGAGIDRARIGRTCLFVLGVLAPVVWMIFFAFELHPRASELALALTIAGASTGILLQWAWLSRMAALAARLESRLDLDDVKDSGLATPPAKETAPPAYLPTHPPAKSPAAPVARKVGPGASHADKGHGTGSPPAVAARAVHEAPGADYGYDEERYEKAPVAFPPQAGAAPTAASDQRRDGRRLEPLALAAAWNELKFNGNGSFDAKSLAAVLAAANLEAEIKKPDDFVGLGVHLLVAIEPGQRERAFLLPDFTRLAKAFDKWFDSDQQMSPSARIERLLRPAELKRTGDRYELAERGRLE